MAIQVGGTTVIDDSRNLSNVGGLKTVGGNSILGSGDIATGGSTTAGAVGTYALVHNVVNASKTWGTTISGSSIYPGALINGSASPDYTFGQTSAISESITLSGTWRIMGSMKNISRHMSLYVRIS